MTGLSGVSACSSFNLCICVNTAGNQCHIYSVALYRQLGDEIQHTQCL
jgi:hypothetical protein